MKKITFVAFAAAIAFAFSSCSFAPNAPGGGYFDDAIGGEPIAGMPSGDQFEEFTDNPFISMCSHLLHKMMSVVLLLFS